MTKFLSNANGNDPTQNNINVGNNETTIQKQENKEPNNPLSVLQVLNKQVMHATDAFAPMFMYDSAITKPHVYK